MDEENEIFYKVVRICTDGSRVSFLTFNQFEVEYKPNEWAKAKVGGLLVFTSLWHAELWFQQYAHADNSFGPCEDFEAEIWECDVRKEIPLPKTRILPLPESKAWNPWGMEKLQRWSESMLRKLWSSKGSIHDKIRWEKRYDVALDTYWPHNVRAFREVKLTKRLCDNRLPE